MIDEGGASALASIWARSFRDHAKMTSGVVATNFDWLNK
jgi:hypothetical protein